MKDSHSILIVAGEESSSVYAQRLLEYWNRESFSVKAFGVGSQAMERLGFERLGHSEEMAVVGIQEVLPKLGSIYKVFNSILERVRRDPPQVALLLDYPDFNLRLAKKLKALGIPVVYYISPQIWAWRSSRVHEIRENIEKMLVVFPFEETFYKSHGVSVTFVGHPLLDEVERFESKGQGESSSLVGSLGTSDPFRLGLMPGSRFSEVKFNLETQIRAAERLALHHENLKISVLAAPSLPKEWLEDQIQKCKPQREIHVVQGEPMAMIQDQHGLICTSGTATLLVGLMGKPFVAMYKLNKVSAFLAKYLVRGVEYFCIVNLILRKEAIPEFFQGEANPKALSDELVEMFQDPQRILEMKEDLGKLKESLGNRGATAVVHKCLLPFFEVRA